MEALEAQQILEQARVLHEQTTQMIQQTQLNEDFVWVLVSAALVFSMQFGFMYLESGLAQAKHSINVAIKNLTDFVVSVIVFWVLGFGLMFGDSIGGLFGGSDFLITIQDHWEAAFFVFQAVFVGTAATIDSGAVAGRTRFSSYLILSGMISAVIYPVFGHWAWGGAFHTEQAGWLAAMGFKDFAGSTVVHSVGGWVALAGIAVMGPRLGKFNENGEPRHIPPYSLPDAVLGTLILFFGWFGFNCGSTLEASPAIAPIAMTTALSACFASASSTALSWIFSEHKRPEIEAICNGLLGGLVGITAGCAYVDAVSSMWIGLISGAVVFFGCRFIERTLKLDDVVGAVAVHGLCGAWGTLAVGLFDMETGLFTTGGGEQLGVQALGVVTCFIWTFSVAWLCIKIIDKFLGGMRVSREDEERGLNIAEHGAKMSWYDTISTMKHIVETGDLSQRVEVEYGTEAGEVAAACNHLLLDMEQTADVAMRVAKGDYSDSPPPKGERDVLGQAIATMVESLSRRRREQQKTIHSLGEIVRTGDLTRELSVPAGSDMASVAEGFNELLHSVHQAAKVAEQVSRGNLEQEVVPKSEHDILNTAVGKMLESLRKAKHSRRETVRIINGIVETGDLSRRVEVRDDPEMARVARGFNTLLDEIHTSATILNQVAEGDLRHTITPKSDKDILSLATAKSVSGLRTLLAEVDDVSQAISMTIRDLNQASGGLKRTNGELVQSIERVTRHVSDSIDAVRTMHEQAQAGSQASEHTLEQMRDIAESINKLAEALRHFDIATADISSFTGAIQKIAAQTNLLALNATIEAAGAGHHGKGFAVVAGEIKNLALESAKASEDIGDVVEGIKNETRKALQLARSNETNVLRTSDDVGKVLARASHGMTDAVEAVTAKITTISTASKEQDGVVEQNARAVDAISHISRLLQDKSQSLAQALSYFKLNGQKAT